jgi:hypothetical protein
MRYFTAPHEDWQAAANFLSDRVQRGACLAVAPPEHIRLYEFFHPELDRPNCNALRMVLAITPATTTGQRETAIASLIAQGYIQQDETVVGRSAILSFQRAPQRAPEAHCCEPTPLK